MDLRLAQPPARAQQRTLMEEVTGVCAFLYQPIKVGDSVSDTGPTGMVTPIPAGQQQLRKHVGNYGSSSPCLQATGADSGHLCVLHLRLQDWPAAMPVHVHTRPQPLCVRPRGPAAKSSARAVRTRHAHQEGDVRAARDEGRTYAGISGCRGAACRHDKAQRASNEVLLRRLILKQHIGASRAGTQRVAKASHLRQQQPQGSALRGMRAS